MMSNKFAHIITVSKTYDYIAPALLLYNLPPFEQESAMQW